MADRAHIGQFRDKVTFQAPTRTLNTRGVPQTVWTDRASVFAQVEESGATETVINDNIDAQRMLTVRCYRVTGLNHSWRMSWDSAYWNITSLSVEPGRPFIKITCVKYMQ